VRSRTAFVSYQISEIRKGDPMTTTNTKTKYIYVLGGYAKNAPTDNLLRANAVHSGIFIDPTDYPTPPVDEATFKGAIDLFSTKITAALDGGKKAIAERSRTIRHQDAASAWQLR